MLSTRLQWYLISAVVSLRRMVLSGIENTSVRYFDRSVGDRGFSISTFLDYRLVVLLLRITVATCDRTGTIVDIRKDAEGYPNASHARRLNRLGSQFSVFYSDGIIYLQLYTGDYS